MSFFVVVFLKRTSYNKKTKREVENEKSQNKDKKAIMPNSAPDPIFFLWSSVLTMSSSALGCFDVTIWWLE